MSDFYNSKMQKSRKPRKCNFCGKTIAVDEQYVREVGVYYEDFFERILCTACYSMLAEYCVNVDNEFDWDNVINYVRDKHCRYCEAFGKCELSIFDCNKIKERYSY